MISVQIIHFPFPQKLIYITQWKNQSCRQVEVQVSPARVQTQWVYCLHIHGKTSIQAGRQAYPYQGCRNDICIHEIGFCMSLHSLLQVQAAEPIGIPASQIGGKELRPGHSPEQLLWCTQQSSACSGVKHRSLRCWRQALLAVCARLLS